MKKSMAIAAVAFASAVGAGEAPQKAVNIAHRGMWDAAVPQNTVEAIRRAYDSGARWVETAFKWAKENGGAYEPVPDAPWPAKR